MLLTSCVWPTNLTATNKSDGFVAAVTLSPNVGGGGDQGQEAGLV